MNNYYSIKNFRVFDKNGVTLPIKPLTILTGCNSSGKSSVVKSLVLLNSYLKGICKDYVDRNNIELKNYKLDFSSKENAMLGGFNRVIHRNSKENFMEFGYVVHSLLLGEDVNVSFRFGTISNDDLNNGQILGFTIENKKGEIIYKSMEGEKIEGNLNIVRYNFFRYVWGQYLLWQFRDDKRSSNNLNITSLDESEQMAPFYDEYGEEAIDDIIRRENIIPQIYPNLVNDQNCTFAKRYLNDNLNLLNSVKQKDILFYTPSFEKIILLNKNRVKKFEERLKKDGDLDNDIKKVFEDFYSSNYSIFGDYYKEKEYEFLNFVIKWNNRSTLLFTSQLLTIPNYDIWNEEYMRDWDEDPQVADFINVYDALMFLDTKFNQASALDTHLDYYKRRKPRIFEMFKEYVSQFIRETITISIPQNLSYVSSSLVKIKSLYSLEDSDDFTILLKRYFNAKTLFTNNKDKADDFQPGLFIDKWIKKFDIGNSVKLHVVEGGTGVSIRIYKKRDKKGSLLSELGYGITQLFVVLLRIETAIMEAHTFHMFSSRSLLDPMQLEDEFSDLLRSSTTIAIEEPEVHQHPKFQSMLADVFVDAYLNYNVHFIVETHSEYLIRKLQNLVANKTIDESEISLMYMYDADPSKRNLGKPQVHIIDICSDGRLAESFGEGFFDESDRLVRNLLFIKTYGHEKA